MASKAILDIKRNRTVGVEQTKKKLLSCRANQIDTNLAPIIKTKVLDNQD